VLGRGPSPTGRSGRPPGAARVARPGPRAPGARRRRGLARIAAPPRSAAGRSRLRSCPRTAPREPRNRAMRVCLMIEGQEGPRSQKVAICRAFMRPRPLGGEHGGTRSRRRERSDDDAVPRGSHDWRRPRGRRAVAVSMSHERSPPWRRGVGTRSGAALAMSFSLACSRSQTRCSAGAIQARRRQPSAHPRADSGYPRADPGYRHADRRGLGPAR
jgi:hypothetical protein